MLKRLRHRSSNDSPKSNQVSKTSYYRGAQPNVRAKSPFQKKTPTTPKSKRLTKFIDFIVIVALGAILIYSLIIRDQPRILSNSWAYHSSSVYEDFALKQMTAIKDRTKLTFDEQSLVVAIKIQFPEVTSASVELPILGQKATIRLNIAKPAFVYSTNNVGYILNSDGVLTGTQAALPTITGLPTLIDQSNLPATLGSRVISSDSVEFIEQILAQSKKAKVPVANVVLPAVAQEAQLRTTDKPYFVKFYFGNDVLIQIGQFLAARHQFEQSGSGPTEYLDVRVPGKIFFK